MDVANSLTGGPLGLSVFIILYSIVCLSLSSLLCFLIWKHDGRTTYVFFVSIFTSISTAGSIIQQIHFAASYHNIKVTEFAQRLKPGRMSEVIINGGAQGLDKGLFWIQFYGYNVNSLLILFWAIQLFKGTWNLRVGTSSQIVEIIHTASKFFAIIFPAVLLGICNTPNVLASPVTFLVLCNVLLAISLIAGSITLALTLYKFVQARRKLNSLSGSRRGMSTSGNTNTNMNSHAHTTTINANNNNNNEAAVASAMEAAETRRRRDDRWMVIRFSIAFLILGIFELCIILFQYIGYASYMSTDNPTIDLSTGSQIMAIAQFIPGVTPSLIAFLVWGTTATFRADIARFVQFDCVRSRRKSRLADEQGQQPGPFERLPTRGKEDAINVTTELTIINVAGRTKKEAVRVQEWEESDDNASLEGKGKDGSRLTSTTTSSSTYKLTPNT